MRRIACRVQVACLVAAALLVSGCSDDAAETPRTVTDAESDSAGSSSYTVVARSEDFYDVPEPLPDGDAGDLIKVQPVDIADLDGGTVWRIMYRSEGLDGSPIAVTGLAVVPDGDIPEGGRPVLSIAHGTTGIADSCAPSRIAGLDDDLGGLITAVEPLIADGYVIAGTDYEGLGTPGRHPYLVGESEARGVIDAVRAVHQLPDSGANDRYAVWGHSQGGHAALFTNEIAEEYAPELDLVGVVAAAPPSQLQILSLGTRFAPNPTLLLFVLVGWSTVEPEARLEDVLTNEAQELLPVVDEGCSREVGRAFRDFDYRDVIAREPTELEAWQAVSQANEPGRVAGTAPLLIVHGGLDFVIPAFTSDALADRLCEVGQVVDRRVYRREDHTSVIIESFAETRQWIADRFDGRDAPSSC